MALYISHGPRNKLFFVPAIDSCLAAVDVGYELSRLIEGHLSSPRLPMIAGDALRGIFHGAVRDDATIGPYVALRNWGILFEPDLKIDLLTLFDSYSRDKALILVDCGEVDGQNFYLAGKGGFASFPIGQMKPCILS